MTATRTFAEVQRDALVEQARERNEERRCIEESVKLTRQERMGETVRLGGDYVVEIIRGDQILWTFVVAGEATHWRHERQEDAVLHLIAWRHDPNPNSNVHAAFYAGRVLGILEGEDR